VEALRKKERQDETQFTTKIGYKGGVFLQGYLVYMYYPKINSCWDSRVKMPHHQAAGGDPTMILVN
jgi:hypothetical protein